MIITKIKELYTQYNNQPPEAETFFPFFFFFGVNTQQNGLKITEKIYNTTKQIMTKSTEPRKGNGKKSWAVSTYIEATETALKDPYSDWG